MRLTFPTLALLLLSSCAAAHRDTPRIVDATAEFRPRAERVMAAWATMDVANVRPFYAKEPGLVFFDSVPLKYTGWDSYEKGFKQVAAGWKVVQLRVSDFQAAQDGNVAWAVFLAPFEILPKQGAPLKGTLRVTQIYERRGEDWVIVHEHESAPWDAAAPAAGAKK